MLLLADIEGDAAQTARTVARGLLANARDAVRDGGPGVRDRRERRRRPRSRETPATSPSCSSAPTARCIRPRATVAARSASRPPSVPGRGSAHAHRAAAPRARRDEFELHYQPSSTSPSGARSRVEALLRWNDPERGMVPPGEFIPVAEDSGLIEPIGDWVVDAAIAQAAAWRALGLAPTSRSTSPAPAALTRTSPTRARSLSAAGADPAQFIAEITESAADGRSRRTQAAPRAPCRDRPAARDRRLRRRLLLARPPARPAGRTS